LSIHSTSQVVDLPNVLIVKLQLSRFPSFVVVWYRVCWRQGIEGVGGDNRSDKVGGVCSEECVSEGVDGGIEVVLQLDPGWKSTLALYNSVHQERACV
jgi:hypothetical protein